MVVIAIIGLCASIAIPSAQTLIIRSKQAERPILLERLANDLKNYYGTHGGFPCEYIYNSSHPHICVGLANPDWDWNYPNGVSPKKKVTFNNNALNWRLIGTLFERGAYYHYQFAASSSPDEDTWISAVAYGDLDGNGIVSTYNIYWHLTSGRWLRWVDVQPNRWEP
jgi:type II secretory pathway pseudopilin PulG